MKRKLTNNLGLKLLSIGLAIAAWLMVVNVVNPLVVDSEEVPVEMVNEDILSKANLTYELIGKKTVTVTYEVRTRDRYKVSAKDFYAYADLANLYDVTGAIPVNVEVINRVFSPSPEEIRYAYEVMDAIAEAKAQGKGAIALHGKMVDAPIVSRAQRTIAMAQALGISREVTA